MRFQTARELLEHTEDFHKQASHFYRNLAQRHDQHRIRLLLDYLAKHEQKLADSISQFEQDSSPAVLNLWFEDAPDIEFDAALDNLHVQDHMDIEDIIRLGMHLGDYLIWAYESLASQCDIDEAREAFHNLAMLAQSEKRHLAKQAQGLADW